MQLANKNLANRIVENILLRISRCLRTQDNRATAHPIFVVQQKRRFYGFNSEEKAWLYEGRECFIDDPELQLAQAYYEETGEHLPGWECTGYLDTWQFVQPFFTEKGAAEYIEANAHNLCEPRRYVDSAYRNFEWQAIRAVLLELIESE